MEKRPDPIPCPICGADIDPTLIDNEHALFGTDPQKILDAIPEWGCFAIPGWTHCFFEWPEGAIAAKEMYATIKETTNELDLFGIQHAWSYVRTTITPTHYPYQFGIPERLRQGALHAISGERR
jgi:hypothetical protein